MSASARHYLTGYPQDVVAQVEQLINRGKLGVLLDKKYPESHQMRSDKALYDYVHELKDAYLKTAGQISKVIFDNKMQVISNALGTHTTIARIQGDKLKSKREIRVASVFKELPAAFLRMIVVHELAHIKERSHDKAFYQLCQHMEPGYFQLEFDLRCYLWYLASRPQAAPA